MKTSEKTVNDALSYFKSELVDCYDTAELEQMLYVIFWYYFNINRTEIALQRNSLLQQEEFKLLINVINELKQFRPLAQIMGEWEFYDMELFINRHTLIPRPETEELVQLIINENSNNNLSSILDIGTGSGCIALALKKSFPNIKVFGYDISEEAIKIAIKNAKKNDLEVFFKQLDILNWEQYIIEEYDVIVSNPPYITEKEKALMHQNVLDYEPHRALFVGDNEPLLFYSAIADFALVKLKQAGKLYFEINENFGNEVKTLLMNKNFKNINIVKDINNKDRIVRCNK